MFSHRSGGVPVFIAEIGDAGVGAAIIRFPKEGPVEITAATRMTLSPEPRTGEQSAAAVAELLDRACDTLLTAAPEPPAAVYLVIRSPWTRFRTATAEESYEEPRVVTADLIAAAGKKALSAPSELDRASILEAGTLQVFLNGYPTGSPIGKRARSLSVVAYESDADSAIKNRMLSILGKHLPGREPRVRSGMRALLTLVHERLHGASNVMILDVGGTTTSCAVIRQDAMSQYAAVPEGLTTLLKRVAPSDPPEQTLSMMRMLAADTCSTAACQSLKNAIATAEPDLVRAFGEVFASLAAARRLPNACVLSAPTELSDWLEGFFSRIDFSQFTSTTKPLAVETLVPAHLADSVAWRPGVAADTGLAVAASAVHILSRAA